MDWSQPISTENCPPGATLLDLPGGGATVIGRVVATDQPCNVHSENHSTHLRLPTTGLHMPGDHAPVMEMHWCPDAKVMTGHHLDPQATEEEAAWGWGHTQIA